MIEVFNSIETGTLYSKINRPATSKAVKRCEGKIICSARMRVNTWLTATYYLQALLST